MLKVKEAKAWKDLLAEEKEIMMMSTKDMAEDQLMWWKDTKADIMERKRRLRQGREASDSDASIPQSEPPMMSGGGDGGHSTDA